MIYKDMLLVDATELGSAIKATKDKYPNHE